MLVSVNAYAMIYAWMYLFLHSFRVGVEGHQCGNHLHELDGEDLLRLREQGFQVRSDFEENIKQKIAEFIACNGACMWLCMYMYSSSFRV
jgi:hypothetical protein